jgi:hypothetical protein
MKSGGKGGEVGQINQPLHSGSLAITEMLAQRKDAAECAVSGKL